MTMKLSNLSNRRARLAPDEDQFLDNAPGDRDDPNWGDIDRCNRDGIGWLASIGVDATGGRRLTC